MEFVYWSISLSVCVGPCLSLCVYVYVYVYVYVGHNFGGRAACARARVIRNPRVCVGIHGISQPGPGHNFEYARAHACVRDQKPSGLREYIAFLNQGLVIISNTRGARIFWDAHFG